MSNSNSRVCVDLCSGLGGFSRAFVDAGWKVITVDIEAKFNPSLVADVTRIDWSEFKRDFLDDKCPDVLLASPPCERFSIACSHFPMRGIQKGMEIVGACLEAVTYLKPKQWMLENPKGRLRWFLGTPAQTVRYSDYDMNYHWIKETDFWGNIELPMVKCVRHFKRYEKIRGGQGKRAAIHAKIPLGVSQAVLEAVS